MGCAALDICAHFWSLAHVCVSGCVVVLCTVILLYVELLSCCSMFTSVFPGGFSAVTDVSIYLIGFYNSHGHQQPSE